MKIIFFGTPEYVIPVLGALYKYHKIAAVVTQPPKIAGRGKKYKAYSPVDRWAYKRKIQIINSLDEDLPQADLGIVASYGKIIPKSVIGHFKYGMLNVHPSLLPKYRGASPVQGAMAAGETVTGVTIIKMDELLDHGPIVSYFKESIKPDDTAEVLRDRLFARSAEFLINLIPNYVNGKIKPKEQDHKAASFTKILKKEDGFVMPEELKKDPEGVERKIRAMSPWPGVHTEAGEKRLKILAAHLDDGKLVLDKVQLEGKNPVSWKQFKQGHPEIKFG